MSELRHFTVQFRAAEASDDEEAPQGILNGYATVYDVDYRVGYGLKERIAPGAFDESIKRQGVIPVFYEHDWNEPIGFASMESDKVGVNVEANLFIEDNAKARSVFLAAQAGALREWSIGFMPETISLDGEDDSIEIVEKGDLIEASVVVRGANPETSMVEVRRETADEVEDEDEDEPMADFVLDAMDREWVRELLRDSF